jgi:transposase
MANELKMEQAFAILALHRAQVSNREIARKLGIDRETVSRHLRLAQAGSHPAGQAPLGSKPASQAPTGSDGELNLPAGSCGQANPATGSDGTPEVLPAGGGGFIALRPTAGADSVGNTVAEGTALLGSNRSAAAAPYGTGGPDLIGAACLSTGGSSAGSGGHGGHASQCERYREVILGKLPQGLSAQRIYQDLVSDNGFVGSYYSVRRFVGKLTAATELPFRRMECPPGHEMQVDFGQGAPIVEPQRRRRPHVFRVVLSHSRKGYSEAVLRQRTDDFLLCLENAFWDFGGVTRTVVIDNLKAAVKHPDWYDPELNPRILAFCEHYGTVILPTKPYTPRHKGKVERGVGYVQDNGLKGRTFTSLAQENRHLRQWETSVADTRIHGTTRQQVGKVFQEVERQALLPLPAGRFPFFYEGRRRVNRDGHVEVAKAYYSAPPEYLGREVWVRWDGRMVRIFNQRMEQIAVHAQREPGKFSTQGTHLDPRKISGLERGTDSLMRQASRIGEHSEKWAAAMLLDRGVAGIRVLMGLISLTHRHDNAALERACRIALTHGAFRLRAIRELIKRGGNEQEQFEFLQEHEIIRGLSSYGQIVRAALCGEPAILQPVET